MEISVVLLTYNIPDRKYFLNVIILCNNIVQLS